MTFRDGSDAGRLPNPRENDQAQGIGLWPCAATLLAADDQLAGVNSPCDMFWYNGAEQHSFHSAEGASASMTTRNLKPKEMRTALDRSLRPPVEKVLTSLKLPAVLAFTDQQLAPPTADVPQNVKQQLNSLLARTAMPHIFDTVWNQVLTDRERAMFEVGDADEALTKHQFAIVLLMATRRVWYWQAVLEVSKAVSLITETQFTYLWRSIAAVDPVRGRQRPLSVSATAELLDESERIRNAVGSKDLVLINTPGLKVAYWRGQRVAADFSRNLQPWHFFVELAKACPYRTIVEVASFASPSAVANWKLRLKKVLPADLADCIQCVPRVGYSLRDIKSVEVFDDLPDLRMEDLP